MMKYFFLIALLLPLPAISQSISIQVASYYKENYAKAVIVRLQKRGLPAAIVKSKIPGIGTRYRIRIGQFNTENEATSLVPKICQIYDQYLIVRGEYLPKTPQKCSKQRPASTRPLLTQPHSIVANAYELARAKTLRPTKPRDTVWGAYEEARQKVVDKKFR